VLAGVVSHRPLEATVGGSSDGDVGWAVKNVRQLRGGIRAPTNPGDIVRPADADPNGVNVSIVDTAADGKVESLSTCSLVAVEVPVELGPEDVGR
jgi:hypothetical protein